MDAVIRAVVIYLFVLVIMRIAGKRTLGEMTNFDFVLLLIISEATQQALMGADDYSVTHAVLVIATLVGLDIVVSLIKQRWPLVEKWVEGTPLVLIENGRVVQKHLDHARVDLADILAAARSAGIERLELVRYAVLEKNGTISIIAQPSPSGP